MTFYQYMLLREGQLVLDRPPMKGMERINLLPSIRAQRRKPRPAATRPKPLFPMPKPTTLALRVARPPKPALPGGPPGPPV